MCLERLSTMCLDRTKLAGNGLAKWRRQLSDFMFQIYKKGR